ncbi:FMN reductase [Methylosinus sp. H3A]|uniref:FMN reductase n=1 Tax=Methylosinus sp. H3A TaxID=2785786 RepID=UPI0018C31F62|nr:FMN reductase [Methylosinus sp. H3A]MBG0810006.1 FMN reductase [Methylosinus sp. H3A]
MTAIKLVAVSGGLGHPSRAAALAKAITAEIAASTTIEAHTISVADLVADLAGVISAEDAPPSVSEAVKRIETADALVVTTPVYRGSYTGLFKHLFDLVHYEALIGKPVLLAATGGSDRHSLVIDHQLRPLFAFFQSLTLPLGVYANDSDFSNYEVSSDALKERIRLAVARGVGHLELQR